VFRLSLPVEEEIMKDVQLVRLTLFGLLALVLLATVVAAQDDEAPTMVGPEDLPGADIIINDGDTYKLDSTGSSDNIGITLYGWEITYPDDTVVSYENTAPATPTYDWTPPNPGIYKILAYADDAYGNRGYYIYAADVVEVIPAQVIANTDVSYDHSVAVIGGTLEYRNTNIEVTGGRKGEGVSISRGEQLTEGLTYKGIGGGDLAGHWGPYYTGGYYGDVYEDTSMVLTGSKSIRNSGGNYHYGFTYYFDESQDLTEYNAFVFWLRSGYSSPNFYYCYIYTESGYGYRYMYRGGQPMYRGWYGIYFDLDLENVGYGYDRNMDMTAVTHIQIYMYNRQSPAWIDCAYFDKSPRGDNITEAASTSGEFGGYWSGFTTSSLSYVGSNSVSRYASGYQNFYYYWNMQPNGKYADLSMYNAIKLYTYYPSYYYAYTYNVYFYDANNRYAYYNTGGSYCYFHHYAAYYSGNWYAMNIPFDHGGTSYTQSGFDWSNIRYFRMYVYFPRGATINIDGLEFYYSQGAGSSGPPTLAEDIPHGIYALEDGNLKMTSSQFSSPEKWGAFVRCDAAMTIKSSSFDGLWGTQHPSIMNEGQTYGGILAFNSKVTLDDVVITKASSSGFYIENCDLDAKDLDISGHSADYGMSAGLIVAFAGTPIGKTNTVMVENSEFYNSPAGSGIMVLSMNARGDATVTLDDVYAYKNQIYGVVTEVVGWTGNLTVAVRNSEFELNGGSGFTFSANDAKVQARTQIRFLVEDSEAIENGAYGFLFLVNKAHLKAVGRVEDVETFDNSNNGIGFDVKGLAGEMNMYFDRVFSHENLGNGMYIKSVAQNYKDITGNTQVANGKLMIDLESCTFSSNEGHGVIEWHKPYGSYNNAVNPTENFYLTAKNTTVEKNEGHGWYVRPDGRPEYANRNGNYEFLNCLFSDNKASGFYVDDVYYNPYYYGTWGFEDFYFYNCTFTYNDRGFQQYMGQYSYGMETFFEFDQCTFQDNDYEAIRVTGYWYTYYDSGMSYFKTNEYDIHDSLLDGKVHIHMSGFYDYNQYKIQGKIAIYNNTYTSDEPMFLRIGAYMYTNSFPMEGTVIYKNNVHTSPSTGDGVHVEMYGGYKLAGNVIIEDMDFIDALGNGIYVRFGTIYQYASPKSVSGKVNIVNVDIRNPLEDGILIETTHRHSSGASSSGFYSLLDSRIQGASTGIKTSHFSGEIRNTVFSNIRQETIYTYYGVIDVFESEIGPIAETNLRVDETGAIRLWFELTVKVVWRDNPEMPVVGTTVEIKDNSWTILGVNTIENMDGALFSNLNSYTVLPEGIYTKNPYIVTADFIGIVKEVQVNIKETMEITIKLVDDIKPRLTIETPIDGQEQREQIVTVKGTIYDKHTGVDRVEVSADGVNWMLAELSPDKFTYEYTFEDLPEGLILVRVKGYDIAGNAKTGAVSLLVDSTPPTLEVFTPEDGMRTNKRFLEIVGVTDVGSTVYINDQPIDIQYTLISHTIILAEGPNAVKVASVDYLGNIAQVVRYVTLDTQAPYIDIVNVEDGDSVNEKMLTLMGQTDEEDTIVKFTAEVELVEGANDIAIYAVDGVENDRLISLTVYLDQTAPWLRLTEPLVDTMTDNNFVVAGYVEQGSRVFVNEREVEVSFGYFETTISAPEGMFDLDISAIDGAGNELEMIVPLNIDTIAPAIEVTYPPEGYMTNVETIDVMGTILGTRNEDARYLELYINGIPRLFDYTSGEFSHEVLLDEGVNRIEVEGMDTAGNSESLVRTVMLDSQAPYLSVFVGNVRDDPNWNEPVSLSDFVYVSGFTEIGVALTIDGVSVDVDSETGYFNYTLTLPEPLPGLKIYTKDIVVVSTDAAGNSVTNIEKVNRIEGAAITTEDETTTAEWLILFLAIVIFGMALAGAYGYNRIQAQQELIEAYDAAPAPARVTSEGKVITPPPARPARGGRARMKAVEPEDEVVIEMDDEEV
jgi:hypothetical protein